MTRCWDYTFIKYVFSSAFLLKRAIFSFSTVAWLRMMVAWINQFLVVWFDNISHILCATVAYIHIILIENFMELLRRWKMQIYQLEELLCNVCDDCVTITRLNHMMLRWRCRFTWLVLDWWNDKLILLQPLRFRASSYSPLAILNTHTDIYIYIYIYICMYIYIHWVCMPFKKCLAFT